MAQEFKAGEIVPQSGIYLIEHDPAHIAAHEVTVVQGRRFPVCRHCQHLRFTLVHAAQHIDESDDFRRAGAAVR